MKCPACGTRNNFYHRYCYFCGEKLGAMIDPPDDDRPQDQESGASAGDPSSFAYDDRDTVSEKDTSPAGYIENEDYSKESYFTQENTSVDMPEDYFGYPTGQPAPSPDDSGTEIREDAADSGTDDIDYFGYPAGQSPIGEEKVRDAGEGIAADTDPGNGYDYPEKDAEAHGEPEDYFGNPPVDGADATRDAISAMENDIAAKISYMEKYMDDYLSGRIGQDQESAPAELGEEDDTPIYNDSLDFIRIEEEEPPRPAAMAPKPQPIQEPIPPQKPEVRQEPPPAPMQAPSAAPPPPPAPSGKDAAADIPQDEYDPYEDEETSRMIDMLYQNEPSSQDSSYPRRSRRHAAAQDTQAAVEEPDGSDGNTLVKVMISLVIIALMGFAGYVLWNEFLNPNNVRAQSTVELVATHTLDQDTLEDGTKGQRLTLYAPGGSSATIFGETYPVEDNKVQVFYSDEFLLEQYQAAGDAAENNGFIAIATVYGTDGKVIEHEVPFVFSSAPVQLAVFSPEGDTVEVQGNTCTLEISVQPGAQLFVNDTDYTGQVGPDGLAVIDIDVTGAEEMPVRIRASLEGYTDAQRTITLVPVQSEPTESLLVLNESIPLSATGSEVTLTGQVPPGSSIETSLPQTGSPAITDNGAFSLTVQIPSRPGYSVCQVRVLLDGTQVEQKEVIIDKTATFNEYTTGPWEFSPYADYKADPALHEGYRFQIPGKIKEVVSQSGDLTVCTVDTNPGGEEQLIRVWFWGDFSHTAGASVTVYGNRWGNEEGVPRILAKYIVSN